MGPKKKKTKKQVKEEEEEALRLAKEEAEEKLRQKLARLDEIVKLEQEAKLREKQEQKEHRQRLTVLEFNFKLFQKFKTLFFLKRVNLREQEDWKRYLLCDRLPFPNVPSSMNTHLSYWSSQKESEYMDDILNWIEKYIILINDVSRLIEDPLNATDRTIQNWIEVRESYRSEIFKKFDQGTFHIMRKIQTKMNRIDYWTVDYKRSTNNIKICMWAWLKFPISELTKRSPPTVDFPEIGITIRLPLPYDRKFVVIRVIHVTFDPLSDSSKSWQQPALFQEGSITKIVDKWYKRKAQLQKLQWKEEAKKLEMEKIKLTTGEGELDIKALGLTDGKKKKVRAKGTSKEKSRKEHKAKKEKVLKEAVKKETKKVLKEAGKETKKAFKKGAKKTLKKGAKKALKKAAKKYTQDMLKEVIIKEDDVPSEKSEEISPQEEESISKEEINKGEIFFDDYDIKEDILDCMFAVEDIKKQKKSIIPLRNVVSNTKAINVKFGLLSLNVEEKYKRAICNYFRKLPMFDTKELEEAPASETELFESRENTILGILRTSMVITTAANEINLRKHTILGGVYYLDLINQIDQRFPLKDGSFVQIQYGKYEIERDDFVFIYEPPKIVESNEDEEEKPPPDDNIDKLIHVEINLPEHILWFEAPAPVLWHYSEKMWSNQHVYDIRFNEEKQRISFKVGRTLPIGLSAVRYNNLPFQTWELRPGKTNTVLFSLTASNVIMEFIIKGDKVALESLQNATGGALEPILGKFFLPNDLINIMKRAGVDIFPGNDAFLYIEGHSVKDYVIENSVYMGMAMFSPYFQFSWSRWNMLAGWGTLVYQTRQSYSQKHLENYSMVMSDLYHTTMVACSEVSPAFSEESIPNIGFNADLYSLLKHICSTNIKTLIDKVDVDLTNTVFNFISKTKFFSYS